MGRRVVWVLFGLLSWACDDDGDDPQETAAGDGGVAVEGRFVDYIRAAPFPRLVIEVDAVEGREPLPTVFDGLADGLGGLLDKPEGIEPVLDGTLPSVGDDGEWTFEELDALAAASMDLDVPADTIVMHFLYVDGVPAAEMGDQRILAQAWNGTHVAIFKDTIDAACDALALPPELGERVCAAAELGVVTHEVGHLLGLVNLGLPMVAPHEDPERPGHDANPDCIMYWLYEGQALVDVIHRRAVDGALDLGFDQACRDDIANVRDAP